MKKMLRYKYPKMQKQLSMCEDCLLLEFHKLSFMLCDI